MYMFIARDHNAPTYTVRVWDERDDWIRGNDPDRVVREVVFGAMLAVVTSTHARWTGAEPG